MGYFFFDDSVHDRGGFVLGAFVYCEENPASSLETEMAHSGLAPGVDEFKSGTFHAGSAWRDLREAYWQRLSREQVGIVVAPRSERERLGLEALRGLRKILEANSLGARHVVHFDQGVFQSARDGVGHVATVGLGEELDIRFDQNSKRVLGLQLADLAAHAASMMLLAELGVAKKLVKAGPDSGYDPDMDMELNFEMFARLRYSFFSGPAIAAPDVEEGSPAWWVDVRSYGLHLADGCPTELRDAADSCFGTVYLGCIH